MIDHKSAVCRCDYSGVPVSAVQRGGENEWSRGQDTYHPDGEYTAEIQWWAILRPSIRSRKTMAHANGTRFKRKRPPNPGGAKQTNFN